MASEFTSDEIRQAQFKGVLRGLDRAEVGAFLQEVAAKVDELESEKQRLQAQLGDVAERDLESEFDTIGREVAGILQAAREAADSMRERASVDAARWRSESMAEAESSRRHAAADAEAMRRDAWTTGSEMLDQASDQARKTLEQSERDVLTVMGEAEREAHRLTSSARREAEDLLRGASMDADKTTSEATKRRDDIIEAANRTAAQAQERTRALEQRRDELLEELENVRSTLTRLEGSLEEKRDTLDLSSTGSTVRVVPTRPPVVEEEGEIRTWEPGETVRVVRADTPPPPQPEPVDESPETVEEEPEPEVEPLVEPPSVEEEVGGPVVDVEEKADDVGALFASLRDAGDIEDTPVTEPTPELPIAPATGQLPDTKDWIDVRDARLLPITNRALRGAKKSITELQNIALDSLRTDETWRPDDKAIAEALQAELIAVWAESFAAGHGVAEEMTGSKLKRPATPQSDAPQEFASALGEAVAAALDETGEGQRERQSAASRVYRVWRTDEVARRIHELAIHAYEQAVEMSVAVDTPVG